MTSANLLHAHGLVLNTPGGRPLFRDLTLILNRGERVGVVGRNGAGKSSLLEVLAGRAPAQSGEAICYGRRTFVPQSVELDPSASPGEVRRSKLQRAFETRADLLILDEPTQDLDQHGAKRSSAQVYQGKRNGIQQDRLEAARAWVEATRRALAVNLPLAQALPQLPAANLQPIVQLEQVSARAGDRVLFDDLTLELNRERIAVRGPNGSGKSTLLTLLSGGREPERGRARSQPERIGYIAQNAANWCLDESLVQHLRHACHLTPNAAASCIHAHKFPFALAERALMSLSPGERLRAALICLLHRPAPPELLILDEPTSHLDFLGYEALQDLLSRWTGGLVIASHDDELMRAARLSAVIDLARPPS